MKPWVTCLSITLALSLTGALEALYEIGALRAVPEAAAKACEGKVVPFVLTNKGPMYLTPGGVPIPAVVSPKPPGVPL